MKRTIVFVTLVAILIDNIFHNAKYLLVELDNEETNIIEYRSLSLPTQSMAKIHAKDMVI